MMQQYREIKDQYPDSLLFYRMGDFFELFFDDAILASKELSITLTSRDGEARTPMAGVPHHALENHVAKLLIRGYRVVVCDQVEDPKQAKGLVKREVTRILTPGTLLEAGFLAERRNNYLAALSRSSLGFGLAYCDVSTGEFRATQLADEQQVGEELARIAPAEVLLPVATGLWGQDTAPGLAPWQTMLPEDQFVTARPPQGFTVERGKYLITTHFQVGSLEGFGLADLPLATAAAGAILGYLQETRRQAMPPFATLSTYRVSDFLLLDPTTCRNLELTQTARDGVVKGSLLWVLDHTQTAMGARRLRQWILHPLRDRALIEARQHAIQELVDDVSLRLGIGRELPGIRDLERLASRVSARTATARELVALKESLQALPRLAAHLACADSSYFRRLQEPDGELLALADRLEATLVDAPPLALTEGGLIRTGVSRELDELHNLLGDSKDWLTAFEAQERERTGIRSLKVSYSKTFGYFIEVTHANAGLVPVDYQRKQTLTNAERYITPGLKDREAAILGAQDRIGAMEYEAFQALRESAVPLAPALLELAGQLAELDALASLAEAAVRHQYVCPRVDDSHRLHIEAGRHPVVEHLLPPGNFVPNDVRLDQQDSPLAILTGPNMAGKSTYMRQVALIVLLAQMGSFVPARSAQVGLVDRIFTRVGAVDDLATGQSTFMVEMNETANILNNASRRALIILDEIGRGTSTFDGISIAWSVCEHLVTTVQARTLFATHYHELTGLATTHPSIRNYRMLVEEDQDEVRFLRRVVPGGADRSYGIEVARLAGLPAPVVTRARQVLKEIERRNRLSLALRQSLPTEGADPEVSQLPLFGSP